MVIPPFVEQAPERTRAQKAAAAVMVETIFLIVFVLCVFILFPMVPKCPRALLRRRILALDCPGRTYRFHILTST